ALGSIILLGQRCDLVRHGLDALIEMAPVRAEILDHVDHAGWRSTPGTMPAMSQLDWLISITAISVLSPFRTVRDRLRSFNFCMGHSIGSHSHQRRWMQSPRRRPHSIFPGGFRTTAPPVSVARTVTGRHPKPF